ncbi:hypothetical protein Ahy_B07g087218 [Arachis hypogaea]|uniref:Aminotransferase-like plant mobile domain-containing protein n=1 Tax=Arachis hypogaea TaxID=3818 RepID=A0A444YBI4_ARAHY|nr:hypothetical protein Ahy_B07g087218 [Arachis hypogaea]
MTSCSGKAKEGVDKNILPRKLDMLEMLHPLSWVRYIRDTQPLDTWESVQCHIFYLLGTTLFADKSTVYAHVKYLPLLQNFEQIDTYSWGLATLAHLYRALCRASWYDCKEMDGPLDFECPFLCPFRDNGLHPLRYRLHAGIIVESSSTNQGMSRRAVSIRHDIDYMEEFAFRPYLGIIILAELQNHLDVCDTVGPLVSFECVEWHPVDRVGRQYGYAQSSPLSAQDIHLDQHCYTLRGHHTEKLDSAIREPLQLSVARYIRVCNQLPTLAHLPITVVPEVVGVHSSAATPAAICSVSAFSYHRLPLPQSPQPNHHSQDSYHNHHSLPQSEHVHLGFEYADFFALSSQVDQYADDAIIRRFLDGGDLLEDILDATPPQ